ASKKSAMERLGRYEILEELGRGAMGTVYRARDPKIDRIVALKTISISGASEAEEEEFRQRFFREAQAAGKLSHPGLVVIHDVGEDEATQTPYIVMEFIEGKTLEALAAQSVPVGQALAWTKQVAEALDCAHARGIIHRDIKPANIIVTEEGRAKITDFGIAKSAMTQATQAGTILGTPAYMSPEQLEGRSVDGRSDLFSLGVILYRLLTGQKPFTGDSVTAVSYQVVYKDPRTVTQLNPELSLAFDYVVGRALAKDPAQRYPRGSELANDLDDLWNSRRPSSLGGAAAEEIAEKTLVVKAGGLPAAVGVATPAPSLAGRLRGFAQTVYPKLVHGAVAVGKGLRAFARWSYPKSRAAASSLRRGTVAAWRSPQRKAAFSWGRRSFTYARRVPLKIYAVAAAALFLLWGVSWLVGALGPKATLNVQCQHSFRSAELTIWADDQRVFQGEMSGVVKKRLGGLLTDVEGSFAKVMQVPAGERTLRVRVAAPDEGYEQTREIAGEFGEDSEQTLYIGFSKRRRNLYLSLQD
ncbi:MAG: serine/threonine-protein kinase, partial [Terriglobia bacterium]